MFCINRQGAFLLYLVILVRGVYESSSSLELHNNTLGENLHIATPFSLPCFSTYEGYSVIPNASACSRIQTSYGDPTFRSQFYNAFMNSQDEICISNVTEQCLLDNEDTANPHAFTSTSCNQGSVSRFYIDVESVSDIITALQLSRDYGIKLSIKNSGHDFLGRSSMRGSLALWMRNLRNMVRSPNFVPQGCSSISPMDTITTAAGVSFDEVYKFADGEGVTFVGGYASTVGVSGGWLQGGGHSVLSPIYGLGVDRVVQLRVITADGILRVANACSNPDLFWALRGGGGGTFGVVIESTHRVAPPLSLSVAFIEYNQTATTVNKWFEILVNNSLTWTNQGWGGHYLSDNLISVNPLLNLSAAEASMAQAADFTRANGGTAIIETSPSWYSFYTQYVLKYEVPVGRPQFTGGRLIPASQFTSAVGRGKLLSFLKKILVAGLSPYISATTPYLYPWVAGSTSASPAWRDSIWELGYPFMLPWNSTLEERKSIIQQVNALSRDAEKMTPEGGEYLNEASPWTENWKEAWWGENYERLSEIKKKYDPEGIFSCWKCIGFEEQRAERGFECFAGPGIR